MKNFVPELFIGIGETNAFFTLRETYLHEQWRGGKDGYMDREVRSYHHFNLSQDANTAVEKAIEHSEKMGLKLNADAERLSAEMREINRATAEQLAKREAHYAALKADQEAYEAERLASCLDSISKGIFANGPYRDKPFTEAPLGYLNWLMDTVDNFEEGSIMKITALKVIELHSDLRLPQPDPVKVAGVVGKRMDFNITVVKSYSFIRPGFGWNARPETCYVTTMVTDNNECLVCFSGAFSPDVGEKIKVKGTVKEHSDYRGQVQTIIQRVKEVVK